MSRDDFTPSLKTTLAKRVSYLCSNPDCRSQTVGPHTDPTQTVNLGVAAHICAASAGGPRYDHEMDPAQRASIENAIWLCQSCAKLVDSDVQKYRVLTLAQWKVKAELEAEQALGSRTIDKYFPQPASAVHAPVPLIGGATYDEAREDLLRAGWQPLRNHWSHASEPNMQYGNGLYFWEKGYHEIRHASGTGLAFCDFAFRDIYGNVLVVVTAGEPIDALNDFPVVWSWHFEHASGSA